jgi:hypothetical protein
VDLYFRVSVSSFLNFFQPFSTEWVSRLINPLDSPFIFCLWTFDEDLRWNEKVFSKLPGFFSGDSNTDSWESFWVFWCFLPFQNSLRSFFFSSRYPDFVIVLEFVTVGDGFALELRSTVQWWESSNGFTENRNEIHKSASNCWFRKIRVPMWFCAFLRSLWNWNCFEDCEDSVGLNCVWIEGFDGELKRLGFGEDELHAKFLMNFEDFLQISEPWS